MTVKTDYVGTYKRTAHDNFDEFLKSNGAPWAGRKIVCAESPTLELKVTETEVFAKQSGAMSIEQTLVFDADAVEFEGKKGKTMDTAVFEDGKIIVVKLNPDGSKLTATRTLSEDKNTLTAVLDNGSVKATLTFTRQ